MNSIITNILVCCVCGYIVSHAVLDLLRHGYQVIVLDDNSTSNAIVLHQIEQELIQHNTKPKNFKITFYQGRIQNKVLLDKIFSSHNISYVMHFSAFSLVGESMTNPLKYYNNNFIGTLTLIESMLKHNVYNFIFSSTAAVYGKPKDMPITEQTICKPTNSYGSSKLMVEQMLKSVSISDTKFRYIIFRYFNAAGNDPSLCIGEEHNPETHLIPIVLQTAKGMRDKVDIYGTTYPTKDGTCIRDYIHVNDIVDAHRLAIDYLTNSENKSQIFNLGTGVGFSVKEMINAVIQVTETEFKVVLADPREGDPPVLIASADKVYKILNWKIKYTSIDDIIKTSWLRMLK